ncbi:FAD-dependent monooxygenase [Nocardia macrotermitis]|uniref:Anhydrotetracycline monooxygenase n=1 Tax=Nocardia macrotermitis TaxID=2585198 RepID=A0A7K0CUX3_9NOCA|nr:FAD-dependent monooxygenase [Nocardia macrotermitis]MQY17265.1 Anhydrotetracycline monooxygenase [Nocardia macrotermitis]
MSETATDVIVSGAGPNGLMLACELALAGVRPIVLDPLAGPSPEPKANGLVGQVVRMMDIRGLFSPNEFEIFDSSRAEHPEPLPHYIFSGIPLELAALQHNPMYGWSIPQPRLIELLTARAEELGVRIRWGNRLIDFRADDEQVVATVQGPEGPYELTADYLVGADGGKSLVRKQLGIAFRGTSSEDRIARFAHARVPEELRTEDGGIDIPGAGRFTFGHNRVERGMFIYAEMTPGRPLIGATEHGCDPVPDDEPVTFDEVRRSIERVLGVPVPIEPPTGPGPHALRRLVGQNTLLAEHYRRGRVLLVGDSAHVHSSMGGPGLNLGLQDTINLGWKLGSVVRGDAPEDLLDTYESERHPVAERVMMHSLSQTALIAPGPEVTALRELFGELMELPEVANHLANLLAGSDVRYDIGDDHPLAGRLVPDLTVTTEDGSVRVDELLRTARPILLDLSGGAAPHAREWADRVDIVDATADHAPAAAMLIRPDGYIAWATQDSDADGLRAALARWFGPARALAEVAD